jgi:hypothetical protein
VARNVNDIIKKLSAALRRKVAARADQFIDEETTLRKIRKARKLTQQRASKPPPKNEVQRGLE